MSKKFYAQKDKYGFPVPGTLMSVNSNQPLPKGMIEIPEGDHIPNPARKGHPSKLRYYVRHNANGSIIPNSLIATLKRPKGLVYEYQVPADGINNILNVAHVTDTIPHDFPLSYPSIRLRCSGVTAVSKYTSYTGVATMTELITLFNSDPDMSQLGIYSALDNNTLRLTMSASKIAQYCPSGDITMILFED
jgi:hypothetical protein